MLAKFNPARPALLNDVDHLFTEFFGADMPNWNTVHTSPAVNITEEDDRFALEVAAPGLNKEDFELKVEKDLLSIKVEKEHHNESNGKVRRREFSYYKFERHFTLPETADAAAVSAAYENGVLMISIPKKEEAKDLPARTIEVG